MSYNSKHTGAEVEFYLDRMSLIDDRFDDIDSNVEEVASEVEKLKDETVRNKGYYRSIEDLSAAHPTAEAGARAYVGYVAPYTVYVWDSATSSWIDTGETAPDPPADLGNYYTKQETHNAIKDEYEVLSIIEYDTMASKEDKLYFCYDD